MEEGKSVRYVKSNRGQTRKLSRPEHLFWERRMSVLSCLTSCFQAGARNQQHPAITILHAPTVVLHVCQQRPEPTCVHKTKFPTACAAQLRKSLMLINGRHQSMQFLINPWEWCCKGMQVEKQPKRMQFTFSRRRLTAADPYAAKHFADRWQLKVTKTILHSIFPPCWMAQGCRLIGWSCS